MSKPKIDSHPLKKIGKDNLKILNEYLEECITKNASKLERATRETFEGFQGRLATLRVIHKEITYLIKGD